MANIERLGLHRASLDTRAAALKCAPRGHMPKTIYSRKNKKIVWNISPPRTVLQHASNGNVECGSKRDPASAINKPQ
jgi:hypothetical protein